MQVLLSTNAVAATVTQRPTSYLLSISNPAVPPSGGPPIEWTLPLAERLHQALIVRAAGGSRIDCPELTGHASDGQPLLGPHRHAYLLPVDLDQDGALDHVIVHASMGFGKAAQGAIESLRWLKCDLRMYAYSHKTSDGRFQPPPVSYSPAPLCDLEQTIDRPAGSSLPVRVIDRWRWSASQQDILSAPPGALCWGGESTGLDEGEGLTTDFQSGAQVLLNRLYGLNRVVDRDHHELVGQLAPAPESCGKPNEGVQGGVSQEEGVQGVGLSEVGLKERSIGGGLVWRSLTPMVLPRYLKRSGKNDLVGQVQAELASRGFSAAAQIEVVAQIDGQSSGRGPGYVLNRSLGGKRAPHARGYFLVIRFADPVTGPLALGYASHFGLGLFSAIETG